MRIARVTPLVMGTSWRNLTYLKVETDEGLTGWGEVRMLNHTDALIGYLQEAAPNHIIGSGPRDIEDLVFRMYRNDYARAGEINMCAIAVVEMACWDILGKSVGLPVWRLLGGKVRDRIKAYANGWYRVERTPEGFHAAARAVIARGYRALKFDPYGAGYYEMSRAERVRVVGLVEAVRDAIGPDVEILLEMHGRFNPVTAVQAIRDVERFGIGWAEEPVPPENIGALQKVSQAVGSFGVPVATGERIHTRYDYQAVLDLKAADIIQPDITHMGGIWETRKLAAQAETQYVLVAPHNTGGPLSAAAALHLAACTPNFKIQEYFNDFDEEYVRQAATGLPRVDPADGCFALPEGPGLGLTVNEDIIAEHPRQEVFFNLFADDWHRRMAGRDT